jgi:hypothetical protein
MAPKVLYTNEKFINVYWMLTNEWIQNGFIYLGLEIQFTKLRRNSPRCAICPLRSTDTCNSVPCDTNGSNRYIPRLPATVPGENYTGKIE